MRGGDMEVRTQIGHRQIMGNEWHVTGICRFGASLAFLLNGSEILTANREKTYACRREVAL